ncbi:MAG: hypothetical protein OXP08_12985, partial [bacterium]|nr:hypothetical protein [bacterium]
MDVAIETVASGRTVLVELWTGGGTNPGALVATLTNPASLTANAVNTFTAPANTVLAANTSYFIRMNRGLGFLTRASYGLTDSDSQTGAAGWSIADGSRYRPGSNWVSHTQVLRFAVNGHALSKVNLSVSGGGYVTEGSSVTITATRGAANDSGGALVIPIQVRTTGTTAGSGDYTVPASITIANGSRSGTATFTAAADSPDEPAETVVVELGTLPAGTAAGDDDAVTIVITDGPGDLPGFSFGSATGSFTEGSQGIPCALIRNPVGTTLRPVLNLRVTQDGDWLRPSGRGDLTYRAFSGISTPFAPAAYRDSTDEPDGSATCTLLPGDGYTVASPSSKVITMMDDDPTIARLEAVDSTLVEQHPSETARVRVVLSRRLRAGEKLAVPVEFGGPTGVTLPSSVDPHSFAGTVTGHGAALYGLNNDTFYVRFTGHDTDIVQEAVLTLTPTVNGDADQADGSFNVSLLPQSSGDWDHTAFTNVGGGGDRHATDNNAWLTYQDDDAAVSFASATATVQEGLPARLEVRLSRARPVATAIEFSETAGTASGNGVDYEDGPYTLTIPAGRTTGTLQIRTLADAFDTEPDETFTVALSSTLPTGITAGTVSQATVTIVQPTRPTVTVTADAASVTEGTAASFTVNASVAPASDLEVPLVLGVSGPFFHPGAGGQVRVTIPAGQRSAPLSVPTVLRESASSDGRVEAYVQDGYTAYLNDYVPGQGRTINQYEDAYDEDTHYPYDSDRTKRARVAVRDAAVLSIAAPADAYEGNSGTADRLFTATLSRPMGARVAYQICLSGTAGQDLTRARTIPAGADYQPGSGFIDRGGLRAQASRCHVFQIVAGRTTSTGFDFGIIVKGDTDRESDETVVGTLSFAGTAPDGVAIGTSTATHTILNDDPGVTVAPKAATVAEGSDAVFTVTRAGSTASALTVNLEVSDAAAPSDFVDAGNEGSRTVTIPAGQASADYPVPTRNDRTDEPDGDVTVTVAPGGGNPPDYGPGDPSTATVRVTDGDVPTVFWERQGNQFREDAGTVTVEVSFTRELAADLEVNYSIGGTATCGVDYTIAGADCAAGTGTFTLPAGVKAADAFSFPVTDLEIGIVDDGTGDDGERIVLTLEAGTGYSLNRRDHPVTLHEQAGSAAFRVTGEVRVGETLTAEKTAADPDGAGGVFQYFWFRHPAADTPGGDWTQLYSAGGIEDPAWTVPASAGGQHATLVVTYRDGDGWEERVEVPLGRVLGEDEVVVPVSPAVSLDAASYSADEGDALTVTLEISPVRDAATAVGIACTDDTATAGTDYAACPASVTIPANAASHAFTIQTTEDTEGEAPERFDIALGTLPDGVVKGSPSEARATIADDDGGPVLPAVTVTGNAAGVTEGSDAVFTIARTGSTAAALTVLFVVEEGRVPGRDSVAAADEGDKEVDIPAGSASVTWTVATAQDGDDDQDGLVRLSLKQSVDYVGGDPAAASVAIADDDEPAPGTPLALPGTAEAPVSDGSVTVARPSGWTGPGRIQFGGGPKTLNRNNFTALRIGNITDDRFEVTWSSREAGTRRLTLEWQPVAGTVWRPSDGNAQDPRVLTIEDPAPDAPAVTVAAGSAATEGGSVSFVFTATPAPAADLDVSVTVATAGDYGVTAGTRTVTIPASGTHTLTLSTQDDAEDETDGSVTVTVGTGTGYTAGTPASATVAVLDDDGAPTPAVTVAAGSAATEGGSASFTFTATPAPAAALPVSVTVATQGDYGITAGTRTVTIPTSGTYTLTLSTTDDSEDEEDGSVGVTIGAGTNYRVGDPASGTVTVSDNDDPLPEVTVAAGSAATEGGSVSFVFTASPAPAAALPVSVTVATQGDYGITAGTRTVTIPTSGTYTLTLSTTDDSEDEEDGSVGVTIGAGTNYRVGAPASGTVAVSDNDDPLPTVTIAGGTGITEGGTAVFTVTRTGATTDPLTVNLDISDAASSNFLDSNREGRKTVTIAAGSGTGTHSVQTRNDSTDEPDGEVRAVIAAGDGYGVGSPSSAAVAVADNDASAGPTVSIRDKTQAEGAGLRFRNVTFMCFRAELSAAQTRAVVLKGRTQNSAPVSARPWQDYHPLPYNRISIPAGRTWAYFCVRVHDDSHDEEDETFEVVLTDASFPDGQRVAIAKAVAVGTITNDDPMPAAFLGRFGRTVAQQALDGVSARLSASRTPGLEASSFLSSVAGAFSGAETAPVDSGYSDRADPMFVERFGRFDD